MGCIAAAANVAVAGAATAVAASCAGCCVGIRVPPTSSSSSGDGGCHREEGCVVAYISLQHRDQRVFGRIVSEEIGD